MKKITLIIFCHLFVIQVVAQFPEGFETSVPPTGWTSFIGTNGKGTSENWQSTTDGLNGSSAAYVGFENVSPGPDAQDWLVTPQFTPTASTNILSFVQKQSYTDEYGSVYTIRVSTASQTTHSDFSVIDTQNESDFGTIYDTHYVDLTAYIGTPIYLAFVMTNDDGDDWYIDDINLISSALPAPQCASNLSPFDGEAGIDIINGNITISWDAPATGNPALSYEIFWGTTSGSLSSLGNLSETSVFITNISYATTYYWMIVPENYGGSATGCSELSFTSEGAPANDDCVNASVVNALPFNATVDAGGATNNGGFITDCSPGLNDGVWYTFIPAIDGTIDISITNVIDWDPELAIYSGACGALTCVASIDDGVDNEDELLSGITVTSGTQYFINIGYWSSSTDEPEGTFDINIAGSIVLDVENQDFDNFSIFPNPIIDVLNLSSANEMIKVVSIYNLLGQEIIRTQPRELKAQIDMSSLPTGMYIVKIQMGEQSGTYRVVKQ